MDGKDVGLGESQLFKTYTMARTITTHIFTWSVDPVIYENLYVKEKDGYWRMVGDECYSATDEQFVKEHPTYEIIHEPN